MPFDLKDVKVLEQDLEATPEDEAKSLQRAINDGLWGLQGCYGRAMMGAIEDGRCMLGRKPAFDYYGNRIPSRDEVEPGTMGSRGFVAERCGEEYAKNMEEVE